MTGAVVLLDVTRLTLLRIKTTALPNGRHSRCNLALVSYEVFAFLSVAQTMPVRWRRRSCVCHRTRRRVCLYTSIVAHPRTTI